MKRDFRRVVGFEIFGAEKVNLTLWPIGFDGIDDDNLVGTLDKINQSKAGCTAVEQLHIAGDRSGLEVFDKMNADTFILKEKVAAAYDEFFALRQL